MYIRVASTCKNRKRKSYFMRKRIFTHFEFSVKSKLIFVGQHFVRMRHRFKMNCRLMIAIIILAASTEFYLVGCTSNPEPEPLDEIDQTIIASILAGPVKNQSTTSTSTEISTSTPNTTMDTTSIQTTSLETDVIEEPLKLNQLEQKAPGNQLPIAGNMVWPFRAFSVNEKMILITIAVVAFEVMAYRFIERAFDKFNHPENCILGQSLVEHAV